MIKKCSDKLENKIFILHNNNSFNDLALEIFLFQYENNALYNEYCSLTGKSPSNVRRFTDIPFLPIAFFKTHKVASVNIKEQLVFHSSGTSSATPSTHYIFSSELYKKSVRCCFEYFYGNPINYCFIILTPSFFERPDSSLAYMANILIDDSQNPISGYYLGLDDKIRSVLRDIPQKQIFVLGVSFALADIAEKKITFPKESIIMETGGMKGHRKEMIREELHQLIRNGCKVFDVHSEYSMCELFSQAYSKTSGIYKCPPWMRVLPRDPHDPLNSSSFGKISGLNIIDLANLYTCSFIATQDLGKVYENGDFEVLGRFDNSEMRGCSLMIQE